MALTNRQRVDEALNLLAEALLPYFQGLVSARYGASAWANALKQHDKYAAGDHVDVTLLNAIFHDYMNDVFRPAMGTSGVNFMHEVRSIRNDHAHQKPINTQDTLRALDTISRLLEIAQAADAQDQVRKSHEQVMRSLFAEQARSESRKVTTNLNSQGDAALTPWREIATPHEDVRTGNLKEAEFAADLDQVAKGLAGIEYQDPREFFRRTYLTEGLSALLENALKRLHGRGGDPVLELQTNFGGGKTHSMIALYHLASGDVDPQSLPGLDPVLQATGITESQYVQRAVLVGTKLSPNEERVKPDGTVIRTLWGELAYQLAGPKGFSFVAESDRAGTSPGAEALQQVFEEAGPSLILIDEWVAFVRNLYFIGEIRPAAGSFDANLSFAQTLTEAVTNSPGVLLAASLPSSDMEAGGEGGREALRVLRHTFSRVKAPWRAASTTEGFEIVRRRLFQEITDFRRRDGTIKLYTDMYQRNSGLFPTEANQADYAARMRSAYPFHPETFDQLFDNWGSLETFQRTRGVLRLMANVVHTLWERKDSSPLIMPATLPLDAVGVVTEMGGYLPDSWTSVIEKDIDGDDALSIRLDKENGNYDRYSATRRVARTIFLSTAPRNRAETNRGISDRSIRLGTVIPGENASIFGDALRAYESQASYLYSEHGNYWFSTLPSVTQLAQQRIDALPQDDVDHELVQRLRPHQQRRGEFDRVVVAPTSTAEVADVPEVTLVILGPTSPYARATGTSSDAIRAASRILDERGDGRRVNRNALLFLAPDATKLKQLGDVVRRAIVWQSIVASAESLNLDAFQRRQATSQLADANSRVEAQIRDTWCWLLAPHADPTPQSPVGWDARLLRGTADNESVAEAAGKRAVQEEDLIPLLGGSLVRSRIEEIPGFAAGWTHIAAKDLAAWFPSYLYLPRLKNSAVLEQAIRQAFQTTSVQVDAFAWADGYDELTDRYRGLTWGTNPPAAVSLAGSGVIVHPDVARRQMDADAAEAREREERERRAREGGEGWDTNSGTGPAVITPPIIEPEVTTTPAPESPTPLARRYFGSVKLNPQTIASNVREVNEGVIAQLQQIYGAQVKVTLEIEVDVPDGIPADKRSSVEFAAEQLRFDQSDFVDHSTR